MYRTLYGPQGAHINLDGREIINMASNNYLGLANDPDLVAAAKEAIDKYGVGPSASRNIVGNFAIHDELEEALAKFKGVEAVLVFNSGVAANTGVIPVLVGKGDTIYSDELNHGSIIDGCRLSRANVKVYPHMDLAKLEEMLKEPTEGKKLLVADAVFSMDGDLVPLPQLVELAKRYGVRTMIDEAHATGVVGATGRGTEEHYHMEGSVDVLMGTLSKAVGSEGGFVSARRSIIQYLTNKARSFIFSTALSPVTMAAGLRGLQKIQEEPRRVAQLRDNMAFLCLGVGVLWDSRSVRQRHSPHRRGRGKTGYVSHGGIEGAGILRLRHSLPHSGTGERPAACRPHVLPHPGGAGRIGPGPGLCAGTEYGTIRQEKPMSRNLFITGTGTDVGKTFVSALMVKKLAQSGRRAGYFKAAMSGNRRRADGSLIPGDGAWVQQISGIGQPPGGDVSLCV